MRCLLTLFLLYYTVLVHGQTYQTRQGLLLFEKIDSLNAQATFLPTNYKSFQALFAGRDTLEAINVAYINGGCTDNAEWLYNKMKKAQKLSHYSVIVTETNYQDIPFEDSRQLSVVAGRMRYLASNGYVLATQYKRIFLQGKKLVLKIAAYQPFKEFITAKRKS